MPRAAFVAHVSETTLLVTLGKYRNRNRQAAEPSGGLCGDRIRGGRWGAWCVGIGPHRPIASRLCQAGLRRARFRMVYSRAATACRAALIGRRNGADRRQGAAARNRRCAKAVGGNWAAIAFNSNKNNTPPFLVDFPIYLEGP